MANEKFDPKKEDFSKIAIEKNGNIHAISRHYKICTVTVHRYLNRDKDAKKTLEEARNFNTEIDLDLAEFVIRHNMENYKSNPNLAQRSAEFVLNKKGHLRGWLYTDSEKTPLNDSNNELMHRLMIAENKNLEYEKLLNDSNKSKTE